jgi:DNA ligase-1
MKGYNMNAREKLYKIDRKGGIRVWWIEYTDEAYRTCSGLLDGAIVESGWIYPREKNVGRANATTIAEQVISEVASKYEARMYQGKYHPSIEESRKGAKFIECMLAEKFNAKKTKDYPYFSQPKLDGVRCLVSEDVMQTRNGKMFVSSPHIRDSLEAFFEEFPDFILDGELYNHELKNDFEKIISLARKTKPTEKDLAESKEMVEFHVYDVITPEPMTYAERLEFLKENVLGRFAKVMVVPAVVVNNLEEAQEKLGEYLESGYEGQMLRKSEAAYEHRRSSSLLKHKEFEDDEFEIVEVVEGRGNWAGYAKSIMIRLPNGDVQRSGMRGNFKNGKEILENKKDYVGTQVTVRYQNKTADGKLRFPVVVAFWKGKRDV